MEEKGRPWLSKLGVATETTGVVSEWVDWETPRRWALFCKRKQSVRGGRCVGCFTQAPHSKAHLGNSRPRWDASTWRPQRYTHTQRKGVEVEAQFSYLSHLCLTTPGLLVLLLLPVVPATPNKGEKEAYFSNEVQHWFSGNKRSCFFLPRVF